MNRIQSINTRRLIVVSVVLLITSLVLLLWARDVIREMVVIPVSYLLWVIGIIVDTTPQIVFWISILLICVNIAYRAVSGKRKVVAPAPTGLAELSMNTAGDGRVAYWAIKIALLRRTTSSYYQSNFHNTLGRLVIDMLSHRYRLTPTQVEEQLREGMLGVPEDVREYLLNTLRRGESPRGNILQRLWQSLMKIYRGWLEGRPFTALRSAEIDPRIARMIQYMEEELEVSHDDSGR